jgi:hypothetical protein
LRLPPGRDRQGITMGFDLRRVRDAQVIFVLLTAR